MLRKLPLFSNEMPLQAPEPISIAGEEKIHTARGSFSKITGEFWTERQRRMHSLHYIISYRASFKPELPEFFIARHSKPGDVVLDPFGGRGTTALQANMMGRIAYSSDVNPMSMRIVRPKCNPMEVSQIRQTLDTIVLDPDTPRPGEEDFSMFYHPGTYREIISLRNHLRDHNDDVSRFIELLALTRLHGHSTGFFSAYSFPQISVSPENQKKINEKRKQSPEYRPIKPRIITKAQRALTDGKLDSIRTVSAENRYETSDARKLVFPDECAKLIVTSPPFLNKADYLLDNWLELWFLGISKEDFAHNVVQTHSLNLWTDFMTGVIAEMERVLRPDGVAVIEVGEVETRGSIVYLDEVIVDIVDNLAKNGSRLAVESVMIHVQNFTKLANCFNVDNNSKGTNTHRLIIIRKR